ncbi:MAG: lysophospholipase L1-like esterase [Pirellulaceae bacterium]|jgi:lysophospholipase L1-like esterase
MDKPNRRTFVKASLALSTSAVLCNTAETFAADPPSGGEHVSGVSGYNYRLPNIELGSTLLFQGDSITDMKWGRNQSDRNHYLGHSYVFIIASRLHTDMPTAKLNFLNRGMSGHTVGDLKARWQKDTLDLKPDVLSILIGINDVGRAIRAGKNVDLKAFQADYETILAQAQEANPKLKLVLLEPFVLPVGRVKDAWKPWRGEVEKLRPIVAKLATAHNALLIKTQDIFDQAAKKTEPEHWMWDGVHPLPQGHELIARNWIESTAKEWG